MQRLIKNNLIFILIMLLTPGFAGCSTQTDKSGPQVKTAAAQKKKLEATTDITGVLVPNSTSNIASKISGTVKTINADVGSSVRAGDVLITLDTKDLEAQLKQSEAALNSAKDKAEQDRLSLSSAKDTVDVTRKLLADQEEQAKISLDNAEKTYRRTEELFKSGSVSQSQLDSDKSKYDTAKKQYDMARVDSGSTAKNQLEAVSGKYELARKQYDTSSGSALEQAEAAINTLRVQLSNATIVSPINGIVTNKNINAG
ncbi:MAG TPA: biotin/lipoyl-binding protein, partial [Clostridia bacterium]